MEWYDVASGGATFRHPVLRPPIVRLTNHKRRIRRIASARCSVCQLVLICALAGPAALSWPQTETTSGNAIPPLKSGLEAVPQPPLDKMEPAVALQMEALARELTQVAAKPVVSDAELAEAYGGLGRLYNAYEVTGAALACYRNANRLAPVDFRWLHLLGFASAQAGETEKAAEYFRAARKTNPEYPAAAVRLGDAFLQLNLIAEARQAWQAALAIDPKNAAARAGLGDAALAERKYAEAIPHFEAALKYLPGANRLHYSLAMAYRGAGKLDEARAHLAKRGSVGVRPADPLVDGLRDLISGEKAHLLRGRLAFAAGRFTEAAAEFTKAVTADPKSVPAWVNLGAALEKVGDETGAVENFREALRLDPTQQTAHFNLGSILMRRGEHAAAAKHFEIFLQKNPDDLDARRSIAKSLDLSGRPEEALRHYAHVLKADPGDEAALVGAADLLVRGGSYRQALGLLDDAYRRFPDRPRTANALARLLAGSPAVDLRNGERARGIASHLYESQGTIAHGETLAMAMAQLGRCEEAAALQRNLVRAAEKVRENGLAEALKRVLARYEAGRPCEPPTH